MALPMKLPSQAKILYGPAPHGDVLVIGMDGDSTSPLDWSNMLPSGATHLILNMEGYGVVLGKNIRLSMFSGMAGIVRTREDEPIHASRLPGNGRHRCLVISITHQWLVNYFGAVHSALHPLLQGEISGSPLPAEQIGQMRSMSLAERDLCEMLIAPPVPPALRAIWFQGKILECLTLFGSSSPEAGSDPPAKQHLIRQRIDDATLWLREHYAEEFDLKTIARHVGCAPHYLSRLYRQHTGITLSQKLRSIRIDQAAELLKSGGSNVTEAALEVGYNSLSHFTKAFAIEKGVRPSDFRNTWD